MAQTAAATDTAALVASLLETGDDPADAARGERLIDWLVHAVQPAPDGRMLLSELLFDLAALRTSTRYRWARVRAFVKARAVAVYWQALTSHLYAPGQVGAARDAIAYQTDEALRGML